MVRDLQGTRGKKEKKMVSSLGGIEEKKERRIEPGKGEKTAQKKGARNAIKSSFIHTVSSDYPCIYSIP